MPMRLTRIDTPGDTAARVAQDFEDRERAAQQRIAPAAGLHHEELARRGRVGDLRRRQRQHVVVVRQRGVGDHRRGHVEGHQGSITNPNCQLLIANCHWCSRRRCAHGTHERRRQINQQSAIGDSRFRYTARVPSLTRPCEAAKRCPCSRSACLQRRLPHSLPHNPASSSFGYVRSPRPGESGRGRCLHVCSARCRSHRPHAHSHCSRDCRAQPRRRGTGVCRHPPARRAAGAPTRGARRGHRRGRRCRSARSTSRSIATT